MAEIWIAIILGVIQGLTEFLPVSSSGHLELAKYIFGESAVGEESLLMTVVLHFGTALATVYVFRKQIGELITKFFSKGNPEEKAFVYKIVLSMIPAVFVGLFFEKQLEALFTQNIMLVCLMLIITGIVLFIADKQKKSGKDVSYSDAIKVGIAQAIAIIPGISRSGSTIATSVILGIDRAKAAEFSFLMVVPLIFGKMAKDILDGAFTSGKVHISALGVGFIVSFIVGVFACSWMINFVRNSKLKYFAYYCMLIGLIGIIYAFASA